MTGVGIMVALVAAVANAFAVVLQATEARRAPDRETMHASLIGRLAHRPRWLAGTGLMVVAGVLQVLALALAPIAVVQPALATSQLALLAVARVRLGERVGRREVLAALAIVGGLAAVVSVAPRHTIINSAAGRLAPPMSLIGVLGLGAFLLGRLHHRARLALVAGAGVAYAWADFTSKLLADDVASGRWPYIALWIVAIVGFGWLAFLEENSALQHWPAVTVAPVIGAVKVPLPVLMALWTGIEAWNPAPLRLFWLVAGLALVAAGAATLGGSEAVARVSSGERHGRRRHSDPRPGAGKSNPNSTSTSPPTPTRRSRKRSFPPAASLRSGDDA